MVVVKRIKLSSIENGLEEIVSLCSRIKISQEELKYLDQKMKDVRKAFTEGSLSKSKHKKKEESLKREVRRLEKNVNYEIKRTVKKIDSVMKILERVEI
jgi:hypothetical protein